MAAVKRPRARKRADGTRRNPETEIVSAIAEWADEHPGLIRLRRTHCGKSRGVAGGWLYHGTEGWPDFTGGTHFGAALVVEVKREGEQPTAEQVEVMATLREWGWIVIVAHSVAEFAARLAGAFEARGHPIDFAGNVPRSGTTLTREEQSGRIGKA